MPGKHNAGGCGCCGGGPCCQDGWDLLLARFTQAQITGTNIPTTTKTLTTSFATEACGDADAAIECENGTGASDDKLISGAFCGYPFFIGYVRRYTALNTSGCDAEFMQASWAIQVQCVDGVPQYSAQYLVTERAAASGKDCNDPSCPITGDYYLANPVSAGLIYPYEDNGAGAYQSLTDDATPVTLGSDITSNFVRMIYSDGGVCGTEFQIFPVASPSSTTYNKVIRYFYGQARQILTDDVNDLPTSFTLTPSVNPASISASFSFS